MDNTIQKLIFLLAYNLLNALLLFLVILGSSVIHHDGPTGFSESLLKGILPWIASSLFIVAVIFSTVNMIEDYHADAFEILCPTCVLITFVLLLLGGFMLAEACSNNQGYCRNWTLHI